jgi:hypothetical protein
MLNLISGTDKSKLQNVKKKSTKKFIEDTCS